ncbi:single-stranded DNA-binding protein [Campylobacter sp. RM12637]|uniref:single-stranded DNA-binding protein n=1 Tax=Campylobacter sp. RM12637 TaxID=2735734 RepID=UPI003014AEC2|nr:single-stranded DNA-binding protein [Campylobacter sp. RM12637]
MVTLNLVGRIVKDVELFNKQSGLNEDVFYTNNTIAIEINGVDRSKTKPEYTQTPLFFNFVLFGNEAKNFSNWASKGQRIAIVGEWQIDYYTDKNGEQRSQDTIKVFKWQLLDKPQEKQAQTRQTNYTPKEKPAIQQSEEESEVPF